MSDPSKLDEYCERIINEYKDFPPIDYQLGYPLNYKDQVKNAEVRYEISKYQPVIINIGRSLNIKQTDRVSSMPIERDLILKIMAPWGGNEGNTWAYITSGGTEGNIAAIQFGLRQLQKPILIFSTETHYSIQKAIAQKPSHISYTFQFHRKVDHHIFLIKCPYFPEHLRYQFEDDQSKSITHRLIMNTQQVHE